MSVDDGGGSGKPPMTCDEAITAAGAHLDEYLVSRLKTSYHDNLSFGWRMACDHMRGCPNLSCQMFLESAGRLNEMFEPIRRELWRIAAKFPLATPAS